jgi:hypothetical protein
VDAVGERASQLRPGFDQHADGLADLNRAVPVTPAQVVQPRPNLWRHNQGIRHVSCLSEAVLIRSYNIMQM